MPLILLEKFQFLLKSPQIQFQIWNQCSEKKKRKRKREKKRGINLKRKPKGSTDQIKFIKSDM